MESRVQPDIACMCYLLSWVALNVFKKLACFRLRTYLKNKMVGYYWQKSDPVIFPWIDNPPVQGQLDLFFFVAN